VYSEVSVVTRMLSIVCYVLYISLKNASHESAVHHVWHSAITWERGWGRQSTSGDTIQGRV